MAEYSRLGHWHAHEGKHTAVSILSNNGVPIQGGASVMDDVFGDYETYSGLSSIIVCFDGVECF